MIPPESTRTDILPLAERLRIDAVCDRFEADWRESRVGALEDYLESEVGPARARLFQELIGLDLDFRRAQKEEVDVARYRDRFPEFAAVIDAAFDPNLSGTRHQSSQPTRIPDPNATRRSPVARGWNPHDPALGALAEAGYEVIGELGRGGMGVVFRARQPALGRVVALKLIKAAGFATDDERVRFRNEAGAVAQLDHPHIVPVFEVGCCRGLDFFSMKLIPGAGLDRRLASGPDDPRSAARTTAAVADAVHHAHERGILHRDLKPANILVDDRGEPHVTDFGLSRRIAEVDGLTHTGAVVGTPSFMSPEQASGARGGLTTATDIYGLGAVLYALLTGHPPHAGSSYAETLDLVRWAPPEPPSKANANVPRDLEVICLKCLEKDPKRRYPSARALADDLTNWLAGRPIAARPVGRAERAWLWCRRHPLPAALAGLLVVSLLGGFAGVAWGLHKARRNLDRAEALYDYLAHHVLAEASTDVNPYGSHVTVVDLLDRASARVGGDFPGQPEIEAAVRETIGAAYLSLGKTAEAEPHLRAAVRIDAERLGPNAPATREASNTLAALLVESDKPEAETALRKNFDDCRRALGPAHPTTLRAADQLGAWLRKGKRLDEAEPLLRATLAARRRVFRTDHPDTLASVRNLSLLLADRGRFDEAETLANEYEHGVRCTLGPKHPGNIAAQANRGLIRVLRGKPAEAEPYYRQAVEEARRILGPDHPGTREAEAEHARVFSHSTTPANKTEGQ